MIQIKTENQRLYIGPFKRRILYRSACLTIAAGLMAGSLLVSGKSSRAQIGGLIVPDNSYRMYAVRDRPVVLERLTMREGKDGKPSSRPTEEWFMRDSQGRERSMIGHEGDDPSKLVAFLNDPVAGMTVTLSPLDRTAIVQHQLPAQSGPLQTQLRFSKPSGDPLPGKTIAGVLAQGVTTTLSISESRSGTNQDIRIISKRWFSPDLQIDLMSVSEDPRTGRITSVVRDLKRIEPPPELFQIPQNYKQRPGY